MSWDSVSTCWKDKWRKRVKTIKELKREGSHPQATLTQVGAWFNKENHIACELRSLALAGLHVGSVLWAPCQVLRVLGGLLSPDLPSESGRLVLLVFCRLRELPRSFLCWPCQQPRAGGHHPEGAHGELWRQSGGPWGRHAPAPGGGAWWCRHLGGDQRWGPERGRGPVTSFR